jgi:Protein of unknown function (DUF1286)
LKAVTHDVFSLGVGLYTVIRVEQQSTAFFLVLVVWLAIATNELIDVVGHVNRSGNPTRSFWTHSIISAPAWGIAVALASAYLLDIFFGRVMTGPETLFVIVLGAVLAYSHLFLDALTEGGVFLWRRRVALAHMRYNNPVLNGAFAALGLVLLLAAIV